MTTNASPPTENRRADESVRVVVPERVRYQVRFAKTGLLRWIGHQDLARLWERVIRRAGLKPSMTEGFHPKPRIAFPSALALGLEGLDEVVDIDLAESPPPAEMLDRLIADQQPGLEIVCVKRLPSGFGKSQLARTDYRITSPDLNATDDLDWASIARSIDRLMSQPTVVITRKKKTLTLVIAEQIPDLRVEGESIALSLRATQTASMRLDDVMNLLGLSDWTERGSQITRTRVHLQTDFETDDPVEIAIAD